MEKKAGPEIQSETIHVLEFHVTFTKRPVFPAVDAGLVDLNWKKRSI